MGWFGDKDLRMVGLGLVVSAFMVMIYDVAQIGFKLITDDDAQKIIDEKEASNKTVASVIAVVIGLVLLRYFSKTHKAPQ